MGTRGMIFLLKLEHLSALSKLDQECFTISWSEKELADELKHENGIALGYFENRNLLGALLARVIIDEIWIFRIMSHPEHRRQKIAHALVTKISDPLKDTEAAATVSIWLEVAKSNDVAIRFYESEGFLRVSSRLGYYQANHLRSEPEDAWVMCRKF
jgi:[ribosomal protein S18]-alanine N-acetyltransferase